MDTAFALLFSAEEWNVIVFALQHFSFQADIKTQLYYHEVARKVWQRIQEEQNSVKKELL